MLPHPFYVLEGAGKAKANTHISQLASVNLELLQASPNPAPANNTLQAAHCLSQASPQPVLAGWHNM